MIDRPVHAGRDRDSCGDARFFHFIQGLVGSFCDSGKMCWSSLALLLSPSLCSGHLTPIGLVVALSRKGYADQSEWLEFGFGFDV